MVSFSLRAVAKMCSCISPRLSAPGWARSMKASRSNTKSSLIAASSRLATSRSSDCPLVTRQHRLGEFEQDGAPTGEPLQLLCEDYVGTYLLPYQCLWRDGAWHN